MVVHTYSVIIQNQKTLESYSQYQPLFAEAVRSNAIGVCKWIESGTTIDTALPELASLTDDKQEWRAVIVRYEDDDRMAAFESDPRNPYDFSVNQDADDGTLESPVPLVRLTQMLGGVPPLEVEFEVKTIKEEHKAPRTVYIPVKDERKEEEHRRLERKYRFDGRPPSSILIVTARSGVRDEENIEGVWTHHKESESSEFWKRNHFPSICRFLVCDFTAQGPIQKEADDFGFWYSIMLLSINEWDSSTIQAYRLYSLKAVMNRPAMTEAFQSLADRLRDAKRWLERSIRRDVEGRVCEETQLPEYRLEVSVAVNRPKAEEHLPRKNSFKVLSAGALSDVSIWSRQRQAAEEELTACVRSAERTLDQTADKMRGGCVFTQDEVTPLNRYQEEDIQRELGEIYKNVVNIQGKLPREDLSENDELRQAASRVRGYLLGRVMKEPAFIAVALAAVLLILAALPAAAEYLVDGSGSPAAIVYFVAGSVFLVLLAAVGTLLLQKLRLNLLITEYDRLLKSAFNQLIERAGDYSDYMSAIASHARGSSYLSHSNRKKYHLSMEHSAKYTHIKAINTLLDKLGKWSRAYRLDVDFTSKRTELRVEVDTTVAPAENKLYAFDMNAPYAVSINRSGMTMESPYRFASRIEIIREELYDDG